ncbi:polysaccharide deacetylase family protein [soil metagenome]
MKTPTRITIPSFPGAKRIAVTFSFDDGHTHDRRIVEAFNRWGLKATFNLNSGVLGRTGCPAPEGARSHLDACEIAELFRGHEVAIHTVTHPWLQRLDPSQIALEVLDDRRALEDLVGYPVRGMAYPFGTYDDRVIAILKSLGIVYSRTTKNAAPCFPAAEPLAWATTAHQYASNPTVPEMFEALYANARYSGVFFVWGHGYEFHDRDDWAGLERICQPLSGREGVWYCTNIELFDYEAARQRMIIAANKMTAFNPSALPVTVAVDGRLLEIPGGQVFPLAEA